MAISYPTRVGWPALPIRAAIVIALPLLLASATGLLNADDERTSRVNTRMPTVDSQKILAYLRYAEGLASDVEISIGEPKPSLYPGLYELPVRLKKADSLAVRTYYLTKDSRRL